MSVNQGSGVIAYNTVTGKENVNKVAQKHNEGKEIEEQSNESSSLIFLLDSLFLLLTI